jgi:quercetin dioxygenase-like cupin family protein
MSGGGRQHTTAHDGPCRTEERDQMESTGLTELAARLLGEARTAHSRRAAESVRAGRGHALRQTVIALAAGAELAEHESPGEATLQVLHGRVWLTAGPADWTGGPGDLVVIPPERHALVAVEESVVLLTVVKPA